MKVQKFLPTQEKPAPEKQLRDVSNMYEKHFLREMMKAMRSTVQESGFIQTNHAEKIFRGQLDEQYVEKWGEKGGIGLSDLIYTQLVEKFGAQMGIKAPEQKPQGPLNIRPQDNTTQLFHTQSANNKLSFQFDLKKLTTSESRQVLNPWSGVLTKKVELRPDEHLLEVAHANGMKSQILYQGRVSQLEIGKELQSGESLGVASPDGQRLVWNIGKNLDQTGPQTHKTVSE